MSRVKFRLLVTLFAVAALGIGLNLAYPGLGSGSSKASACPYLSQSAQSKAEALEKSGAAGICPYSGATAEKGDRMSVCPYGGAKRESQAKDWAQPRPVVPRDLRNVV